MKDNYNHEVNYLRLSITDRCNLRCIYCMPKEGIKKVKHNEILSVEEALSIVKEAVKCGIKKVRITGGEPLIHKGIRLLCKGISEIPEINELCITTNGILLSKMASDLKSDGVNRINISLDTLNQEKYRKITRIGELSDALKGIKAAEKAGFKKIKINVVLMGGINDDEIEDFVNLTLDHPWEIRFIELMPLGETINWKKERFISTSKVLETCPELKLSDIQADGVSQKYQLPGGIGYVGLISPISNRFCSKCNRIRVTSDGKLKPCLHSENEIPIKGLSGNELKSKIEEGILLKPKEHHLNNDENFVRRKMFRIGG